MIKAIIDSLEWVIGGVIELLIGAGEAITNIPKNTKKEKEKRDAVFDMMVKAEIEIWLHKENLDRVLLGLEPLKWEGYNA